MRLLALGGIAGPLVFSVVAIVSASLRTDYSHVADFISELGATGTPYAGLMNYAGFLPGGLMLAAFGVALTRALPRRPAATLAVILVILFGAVVAVSGIVSCDPGCPQGEGSAENLVHNTIAPIAFFCLIVAAGILGFLFRGHTAWRFLSVFSLVSSVVGLCLLLALASSLDSRELTGLWQRLLLAVLFLWCAVVGLRGFRLLGASSDDGTQPSRGQAARG
ncbi:MAG: DUF998 domain-containing protein [Burkholderiaceae bacterium]